MVTECLHLDFMAQVNVHRLFDQEVGEAVARTRLPDRFSADVSLVCAECGEPFVFVGLPAGVSPRQPMVSIDGTEARLPVRHKSATPGWGEDGAAMSVRVEPMPGRHEN